MTVQGSVVADPAVPAKATLAGTVTKLVAAERRGGRGRGARSSRSRSRRRSSPTVTIDPETGEQTVRENKPRIKRETVTAPVAGTLTLTALTDQVVSVGDPIGSVSPGTLSVTGTLTPDQQYRLLTAPTEAEVTSRAARRRSSAPGCASDRRRAGRDTGDQVDPTTGQPTTASGSVTCAVPAGVIAFAGLGADIAITNGSAEDALVVPVTAVQGSVQTGKVWVVLPGRHPGGARPSASGSTTARRCRSPTASRRATRSWSSSRSATSSTPAWASSASPGRDRRLMALLELTDVTRAVRLPDDSMLHILTGVTLTVDAGEHVSVVGRSGTGKSTLLNILGLLDTPTSGEYVLDGTPIGRLSGRARARRRGDDFGFVFQQFNLLPGRHGPGERRRTAHVRARQGLLVPVPARGGHARPGRARDVGWTPCRRSCPAASSSAWRSPARWSVGRG